MKRKKIGRVLALIILPVLCLALFAGAAVQKAEYPGEGVYAAAEEAVFYVRSLDAKGALKTAGSGFTIREDGLAMTASHVIRNAAEVHVVLESGEELSGVRVLSCDDLTDVAVLMLPEREGGYAFLKLSEEMPLQGEAVYAVGYPLKTVKIISDGIVANSEARINGIERTLVTSDFASGMSGGPVLCRHGEVIGMCSATLRTMNGVSSSPTRNQLLEAVEQKEGNET